MWAPAPQPKLLPNTSVSPRKGSGDTSLLLPTDAFGAEGYLSMLVGQRVPYRRTHQPTATELENWAKIRRHVATQAAAGVSAAEVLAHVRAPTWVWSATFFH